MPAVTLRVRIDATITLSVPNDVFNNLDDGVIIEHARQEGMLSIFAPPFDAMVVDGLYVDEVVRSG